MQFCLSDHFTSTWRRAWPELIMSWTVLFYPNQDAERWYLPTELHGATFLKTTKVIITTFRTSNSTTRYALFKHTKKHEQDRRCAHSYNVTLRRGRVTNVAMETQKCVPFYCWRTYGTVNNVINIESFAMEAQARVPCTVTLQMSLATIWNTLRTVCKLPDIYVPI
jgi:hypothetical protein